MIMVQGRIRDSCGLRFVAVFFQIEKCGDRREGDYGLFQRAVPAIPEHAAGPRIKRAGFDGLLGTMIDERAEVVQLLPRQHPAEKGLQLRMAGGDRVAKVLVSGCALPVSFASGLAGVEGTLEGPDQLGLADDGARKRAQLCGVFRRQER